MADQTPTLEELQATLMYFLMSESDWAEKFEAMDVGAVENRRRAEHVRWLASSLPGMIAGAGDAKRLDWLAHEGDVELTVTHLERHTEIRWRDGLKPSSVIAPTLRDAIDAARLSPGETRNG
jgi:hypothetical protein